MDRRDDSNRPAACVPPHRDPVLHFNLTHTGARSWLKAHAGLGDGLFDLIDDSSHATRIGKSEQRSSR